MVLHDIANDTEFIKVPTAAFGAERLLEGDLNIVNVIAIPGSAEEFVAESQDKQVLDHLLAQVVVDTKDLLFRPVRLQRPL